MMIANVKKRPPCHPEPSIRYFERILKKKNSASLWVRNIQLGLFGFIIGMAGVFVKDGDAVRDAGFFQGFNPLVWTVIAIQAGGGLLVAVVVKYADNILKGFATSVAIIASSVLSIYLFNFEMNAIFVCGAGLVVCSVFLYGNDTLIKAKLDKACGKTATARGYEMVSQA
jgi:UDP-galactose transporter